MCIYMCPVFIFRIYFPIRRGEITGVAVLVTATSTAHSLNGPVPTPLQALKGRCPPSAPRIRRLGGGTATPSRNPSPPMLISGGGGGDREGRGRGRRPEAPPPIHPPPSTPQNGGGGRPRAHFPSLSPPARLLRPHAWQADDRGAGCAEDPQAPQATAAWPLLERAWGEVGGVVAGGMRELRDDGRRWRKQAQRPDSDCRRPPHRAPPPRGCRGP